MHEWSPTLLAAPCLAAFDRLWRPLSPTEAPNIPLEPIETFSPAELYKLPDKYDDMSQVEFDTTCQWSWAGEGEAQRSSVEILLSSNFLQRSTDQGIWSRRNPPF